MIRRLSHATVWCRDQEESRQFYVDKLGFEVRNDQTLGDFRWLTVAPADSDLQLVLMPIDSGMAAGERNYEALAELLDAGALGTGVFETDDCHETFQALSARGVEFVQEPAERPYGVEAIFKDNSGNLFSLTQPIG